MSPIACSGCMSPIACSGCMSPIACSGCMSPIACSGLYAFKLLRFAKHIVYSCCYNAFDAYFSTNFDFFCTNLCIYTTVLFFYIAIKFNLAITAITWCIVIKCIKRALTGMKAFFTQNSLILCICFT